MKTRKLMTLVGLAFAIALLTLPAAAQSVMLQADVPFAFTANKVAMDSGHCLIRGAANGFVTLRDAGNKHAATTMLIPDDVSTKAQDTKLIFHRYGERYILVRIEMPNASYKLPAGWRHPELAANGSPQEVAVLATPAR